MRVEVFLYILVMAAVTYLIRMLPLTLIRRKITNRTLRSFLYYVPYATLSAMTFPAILTATGSAIRAALGFACGKPQGAFYLFVKSPEEDARAFCKKAMAHDLLLVPGDDFGCPGYARLAYCVARSQLGRSLPAFRKLAESYGLSK